jgi:hypothetical protein
MGNQRQISQRITQVARTNLAGSTSPANGFRQANFCFFFHARILQ